MRLDLFLKASRLCPRRSVAQSICDAKLVTLNQRTAKASHVVKPGDEIAIRRRNLETKVRVLALPAARQSSRKEAGTLYELLAEITLKTEE